jgi:hypothetical protein
MQNNFNAKSVAVTTENTDEYTLPPEIAARLRVPIRTDISKKEIEHKLVRILAKVKRNKRGGKL